MKEERKDFVHLHVHSDYSLLDGACAIDRLCEKVKALGMSAVALTDHGNLFGIMEFYKTAKKTGIKPLLGCEVYLAYDHKISERPDRNKLNINHMGLIATSYKGYQNLSKLVSIAHTKGLYYKPRIDMDLLATYAEDLIGLSGCLTGVLSRFLVDGYYDKARKALGEFVDIFTRDRLFVEVQNHGMEEQRRILPDLFKLADEFRLRVVCTNDTHYVNLEDWAAHDALLCIQTGAKLADEKRMRYPTHQFYVKSRQEMEILFAERPDTLDNTLAVAEMCDVTMPFGQNHYPVFNCPVELREQFPTNGDYVKDLCIEGLRDRYGVEYSHPENYVLKIGQDAGFAESLVKRLDYELGIIAKTGFLDYFLIVWDFINWARTQGVSVGPGRGSGAGCIVAYLLKITDIDPIRFKLLFERFLNPERVSPPDFDIDFCMRRRDEVINYVRDKYGVDSVANIITFGTFGAKMVIRDLSRVNDIPYSEADRIAKMIPEDPKITIETAMERSTELQAETKKNPLIKQIIEQGKILEGTVRNTGTHACGIIISDHPLIELIPVTLQEGALTTQYPKEPIEELGLLKMDFLGLKTLTVLSDAQLNVRRLRDSSFDIEKVSLEDKKTFELLNEGRNVGVFQVEASGMQSLCRQFSISNIDEIVALIALYRPGPMEWIPEYLNGKRNPDSIKVPHPLLKDLCAETYGIMVYQEQVMEAAKLIAGYSLGGADILRRAMGKKKVEEMQKQREIFINGAFKTNKIPKEKAEEIFNILEKFAGYGFNKSHSAAYAILTYRTAYLKANYPVEFMSAVLSSELGNAEKISFFVDECLSMGIQVLGPDINESFENFTPIIQKEGMGRIRFGLGAIKGVGDAAAKNVLEEREKNGPFKDFIDFAERVDPRLVNKRVLECLIKTGSFDYTHVDRQYLLESFEDVFKEVALVQKEQASGQTSLFDLMDETASSFKNHVSIKTNGPSMALSQKLQFEKELLGFYISGHPLDAYSGAEKAINSFSDEEFQFLPNNEPFRLCGVISNINKRISKKDNRAWAFFTLSTRSTSYPINIFSDSFDQFSKNLVDGSVVLIHGTSRKQEGEVRLNANEVYPLEEKFPSLIRNCRWILQPFHPKTNEFLQELSAFLLEHKGPTRMQIGFSIDENSTVTGEITPALSGRLTPADFSRFRKHPTVVGSILKIPEPPEPPQKKWNKKM